MLIFIQKMCVIFVVNCTSHLNMRIVACHVQFRVVLYRNLSDLPSSMQK